MGVSGCSGSGAETQNVLERLSVRDSGERPFPARSGLCQRQQDQLLRRLLGYSGANLLSAALLPRRSREKGKILRLPALYAGASVHLEPGFDAVSAGEKGKILRLPALQFARIQYERLEKMAR